MDGEGTPWRRSPPAVETVIDGDISLYDSASETVMVLNATASDVWRLCDGDLDTDELSATLARSYQMKESQIRAQVIEVLEELSGGGFLYRATS